ncbi:MAG: hypothetical protein L0I24_21675, partial [Pseudonocardia sp.]|nr:hypothetical protein [Pseudonocardia sp.]
VAGVPAAPPYSGLVASAVARDPTTLPRWEQGLAWVPERCATAYQLAPWCADPVAGYESPRAGSAFYRPVELRVADACSTLGGPVDPERVLRVANAQTPFAVARELWTGAASLADPHEVPAAPGVDAVNAHLASTDADVVGTGAADPLPGFGRLEQAALEATHGQPVMIHVPVLLLGRLADVFRPVGQQLITHAGNVLVADAGYPGTSPAGQPGTTTWMYATSPVTVLLSTWALDLDETSRVDRAVNTRTTWASRVFAAVFDPCVHLATEITL